MQFVCLVYVDTELDASMTPAEREVFDRENREYGAWLIAGPSTACGPLSEPGTATLIRSRRGQVSMTDGPYVETKEHLAGLILLDAGDRQEAIAIASKCPVARIGTLEVREARFLQPA